MKISDFLLRQPDADVIPFLKWAGGKRWLTAEYSDLFPATYRTYIEPFLGGAAVFFHLKPRRALLSDINVDLIEAYVAIRDRWQDVVAALRKHQRKHSKTYYYEVRTRRPRTPATRAARFLYLNRTCWNGLYRVNLAGEFNVPIGTKSTVIMESDNFREVASRLQDTNLLACDFESTIDRAVDGDLIFVDPPYTVKHNNNGFLKYNDQIFSWADQVRLKEALQRAGKRGAHFAVTNANHASVRRLYSSYRQHALQRNSVISGRIHGRGATEELLVRNY